MRFFAHYLILYLHNVLVSKCLSHVSVPYKIQCHSFPLKASFWGLLMITCRIMMKAVPFYRAQSSK